MKKEAEVAARHGPVPDAEAGIRYKVGFCLRAFGKSWAWLSGLSLKVISSRRSSLTALIGSLPDLLYNKDINC